MASLIETSVARSPQQNGVCGKDETSSEHSSSGPALHDMTPVTISSGLVPNPPPSTPFVPPSRSDWDLLFQPMFDESLNPPPYVDLQAPEVIAPIPEVVAPEHAVLTGSPSSTTVDQDAPSPSMLMETMQEELREFERLEVWELVPPLDKAFVITLKWIYKDSSITLTAFVDADHDGCQDTRHSTSGSIQKSEKPAISSTEAEYIALSVVCLKSFG
ncbi:hypothetical protein Tco_0020300 [Tanacetum coccineum]